MAALLLLPALGAGSVPHRLLGLLALLGLSSGLQSSSQSFEPSTTLALFSVGLVNVQPKLFPQTLGEVLTGVVWYYGRWGHSGWR